MPSAPSSLFFALQEDPWGGKPGTNFKQVGPDARKKLSPLIRHYMKQAHPFTACVRDNTKRFGKERAERVCAVVKDLGKGTTHWRGKAKEELDAALERVQAVEKVGEGWAHALAHRGPTGDPGLDRLSEGLFDDLGLLYLAGLVEEDALLEAGALTFLGVS